MPTTSSLQLRRLPLKPSMMNRRSRSKTNPENLNAPIEGEALTAVHPLQRCRMYIIGSSDLTLAVDLTLTVDHKPLVITSSMIENYAIMNYLR